MGVIYARIVSETVTVAYCMWSVRSLIGIPITTQLLRPWRAFIAAGAMAALLLVMAPGVARQPAILPLAAHTALAALLALTAYLAVLLSLWQWSGRPSGIEAMLVSFFSACYRRVYGAKSFDKNAALHWSRRATVFPGETAHD
jgi:hypothetical protein